MLWNFQPLSCKWTQFARQIKPWMRIFYMRRNGQRSVFSLSVAPIGKSVVCRSVASPECAHWLRVSPSRPQVRTATPARPQLDTVLLLAQLACLTCRSADWAKCLWITWQKTNLTARNAILLSLHWRINEFYCQYNISDNWAEKRY